MQEIQSTRTAALMERASNHLFHNYGERDTCLVKGEGVWAWDAEGKRYLDFLSGIGVNNVGHCHPAVVAALQEQAAELIHCSNGVLIEKQIELAELLTKGTGMDKVMFANSGAEVTEASIKLARLYSRLESHNETRCQIMVFKNSFHGRTMGSVSATWSPKVRADFDPFLPGFVFAEFNNLEDVDRLWSDDICAVMLETVQGEGGIHPAEREFLEGLRERCTERRALLVCDEVQCGMGRTGKPMAFMHSSVRPDIVPVAKALGGGFPMGAVLATDEVANVFTKGRHGTTFGGSPLASAAGCAATKILFQKDFLEDVGRKGCMLWGKLNELVDAFPDHVSHVRGLGLMLGLVMKEDCLDLIKIGRKHGLIFNVTANHVVRLLPPLIITDGQIEEGADLLKVAIAEWVEGKK